jgi:DNA-binding protein
MADKYKRIEKAQEPLPENEIRVKRKVGIGRYLKRAHDLFNETENPTGTVIIKGVSNAVESAVKLAELIKHRVAGLHQINKITNITIDDEYEPLEEGLDHLKFTRIVTMLEIKLSKTPLDTTDIGYQAPIDESEVQEYSERIDGERREQNQDGQTSKNGNKRRGRGGRGRGGRGRGGADNERAPRVEGEQRTKRGKGQGQGDRKHDTSTPFGDEKPREARGNGRRPQRPRTTEANPRTS